MVSDVNFVSYDGYLHQSTVGHQHGEPQNLRFPLVFCKET